MINIGLSSYPSSVRHLSSQLAPAPRYLWTIPVTFTSQQVAWPRVRTFQTLLNIPVSLELSYPQSISECKLHVALHGCVQQKEKIGNIYAANSGYNQVADLNDIVIIYPQAKASSAQSNRKSLTLYSTPSILSLNFDPKLFYLIQFQQMVVGTGGGKWSTQIKHPNASF